MNHTDMLMRPEEYRVMFEIEDGYWWYRGLRALLRDLLARYAPPRDARILDAGCGTGANLQMLQEYGCAIGIDISEQALQFCHARGIPRDRAFIASVTDLPFPAQFFDLAVSFDVICNIMDDVGTFTEIGRVLKPGARLIVQLPAYQWLWSAHDVAVGHQRRYTARMTRAKLERAGFRVERVLHVNTLLLPVVMIERLIRRRALTNGNAVQSDLQMNLPGVVNASLAALYRAEARLAARVDLPFGLSIIAIARRATDDGRRPTILA
ncbi:MAG: methyltransferase domain-containing protein [Chloroflexi bacterium]|nr:methyltransferase domain-containing protein [Chloroflexota bacterium]